jgi:hypothetical protein
MDEQGPFIFPARHGMASLLVARPDKWTALGAIKCGAVGSDIGPRRSPVLISQHPGRGDLD